jgi:hypothetical protein
MKQSYSVALIAASLRVFSEMFGRMMLDLGGESEDSDLLIVKWGNTRAGNLLSLNGPHITAANIQGRYNSLVIIFITKLNLERYGYSKKPLLLKLGHLYQMLRLLPVSSILAW